jgi:hypothetical protein
MESTILEEEEFLGPLLGHSSNDDLVARITSTDVNVMQPQNNRRFMSMSANINLRPSPLNEDLNVQKTSPVKKSLFGDEEEEEADQPFRWERSARWIYFFLFVFFFYCYFILV